MIDIDSLRADRVALSRDGQAVAPNIAQLAREGVRFEHAFAQSGWTVPSLLALLTGRYPVLGFEADGPARGEVLPAIPEGDRTLPEVLRYYGYHTAAFWGATVPHGLPTYWQGFDEVHSEPGPGFVEPAGYGVGLCSWLEAAPQEPFFVLLHDMDLHHPRPDIERPLVHRYVPDHQAYRPDMLDRLHRSLEVQLGGVQARDRTIAYYDAHTTAYDEVVGAVLAKLDASGLAQRTLVVLTSNHGEELFEAGIVGHVDSYRDTLLRVPLIISHPSLPSGRTVEEVAQGIDLAPTLLALAGVPADVTMDGISLVPLLETPAGTIVRRPLFASNLPGEGCYRKGNLKLVGGKRPMRDLQSRPPVCDRYMLMDLGRDPAETIDRCPERPDVAAPMVQQLEGWLRRQNERATGVTLSSADERIREVMKQRGYWTQDDEANP